MSIHHMTDTNQPHPALLARSSAASVTWRRDNAERVAKVIAEIEELRHSHQLATEIAPIGGEPPEEFGYGEDLSELEDAVDLLLAAVPEAEGFYNDWGRMWHAQRGRKR